MDKFRLNVSGKGNALFGPKLIENDKFVKSERTIASFFFYKTFVNMIKKIHNIYSKFPDIQTEAPYFPAPFYDQTNRK